MSSGWRTDPCLCTVSVVSDQPCHLRWPTVNVTSVQQMAAGTNTFKCWAMTLRTSASRQRKKKKKCFLSFLLNISQIYLHESKPLGAKYSEQPLISHIYPFYFIPEDYLLPSQQTLFQISGLIKESTRSGCNTESKCSWTTTPTSRATRGNHWSGNRNLF